MSKNKILILAIKWKSFKYLFHIYYSKAVLIFLESYELYSVNIIEVPNNIMIETLILSCSIRSWKNNEKINKQEPTANHQNVRQKN